MTSKNQQSTEDFLLPHDDDAESAVLGSVLIENGWLSALRETLTDSSFYRQSNGTIFEAMKHLEDRGVAIDDITLTDELRRTGKLEAVGGPAYIGALADGVPSATHAKEYARIVKEKAALRSLIETAEDIKRRAFSDGHDPAALLAEMEEKVGSIRTSCCVPDGSGFLLRTWDLSVAAFEKVVNVDWLVEPFMGPPDVVSLVGDGGVGKSKIAASVTLAVAFQKPLWGHYPVAKPGRVIYVNEERPDLTLRHLHTLAPSMGIDPVEIHDRIFLLGRGPLVWRVTDPNARRAVVQYAKAKGDILLIVWDSLHVLHDRKENDNSEMTQVILGFQEICTSIGCCGIVLHHTGKNPLIDPAQAARGATAIKDTADGQFQIRRPKEDVLDQVRVSQDKTRRSLVPPFLLHLEHTEGGELTGVSWVGKAPTRVEDAVQAVLELLPDEAVALKSDAISERLAGRKFRGETLCAALKIIREQNLARWQGTKHGGYLYGGEPGDS